MTILSTDAISKAMMDGLVFAFKEELKEILMVKAEKEVEALVEKISSRLRIKIQQDHDPTITQRDIKLQWIFKRE